MSDTQTRPKEARAAHDVAALTRWPVLARWMKLAPSAPLSVHEGVEEGHEPARSL